MNISSTPFIRNDYWPDYNDINQLNQRIDDAENEISLVNIRLSADIENVSNNLNTYAKEQADTSISNNIIVNNLNANYAEGRFANFDNTFTNNAYIDNLTVNKPVFDITLNTPHLENTTSLGGNFYNANLFDAKLSGDVSGNLNNVSINDLLASNATISNLYVNTSPTPIQSSAVLGYDREGRVIPVHATYDVGFPENADYLWTDQAGTSFSGVKATEVGEVENLITAYGVKNAIDALNAGVTDKFNLVNNALNDIDQWQNSFENSVANSFSDVANNFSDVNNVLNAVANTFNEVNTNIENSVSTLNSHISNVELNLSNVESNLSNVELNLNNVESNLNNVELNLSNVESNLSTVEFNINKKINDFILSSIHIPEYGSFSSTSPVKYTSVVEVELYGSFSGGKAIPGGGGMIKYLSPGGAGDSFSPVPKVIFGFSGTCRGIRNASSMFRDCSALNQNIQIPISVENASYMFSGCSSLNQSIAVPSLVNNASYMFSGCSSLNRDIYLYFQEANMDNMFKGTKVNLHNVHIPSSVPKDTSNDLYNCLVNGKTGLVFAPENIINDL